MGMEDGWRRRRRRKPFGWVLLQTGGQARWNGPHLEETRQRADWIPTGAYRRYAQALEAGAIAFNGD
jgi:hypothetical protein